MANYTLLDAKYDGNIVKLFYLSDKGRIEEWDEGVEYEPYFYSSEEQGALEAAKNSGCRISRERKKELFSDKKLDYYRISGKETVIDVVKQMFSRVWEDDVQVVEKYAFDKSIRFGATYNYFGESFHPSEENMREFEDAFGGIAVYDPVKYALAKKFFNIIEQPLPIIPEDVAKHYGYDKDRMLQALYLSRITNSPVTFRNAPPSNFIKALYYLYLKDEGFVIPTPEEFARGESPRGVHGKAALVLAPEKGIFFNTYTLDYESLYPSCIDVYNLSHETVNCGHGECLKNVVPEERHHVCTIRRGRYSILIGALKDLRIRYFKKRGREGDSNAMIISEVLKMILVICYGVTIRIRGLANPALAESITAYSRNALKTAWKFSQEEDLKPVYGDTDSIFIVNPDSRRLRNLIDRVKRELKLDLAVDKKYKVCVFSSAKKAYLGIFEDGKIDPKGLVAFKSSTPRFVKNVLTETALELSKMETAEDVSKARENIYMLLKRKEKDLLEKRFDVEDMQFTVILHKGPSEVLQSNVHAQTYQCALQLLDAGVNIRRGQTISFAKVKSFNYRGNRFTVKPINIVKKNEINVADYVSNMYSMMGQILEPLGIRRREREKEYDTLAKWVGDSVDRS
ncbi:MAG: DNA polymerase domain-containing protein [Nitrososphaeria archaeon]